MSRWIRGLAAMAALGSSWIAAPGVRAQGRCPEAARLIEEAAERLDGALAHIRECSVPESRALLESAKRNVREAGNEAERGNCRRAEIRAQAALRAALRAAEICREGDRHREQLGRLLQETEMVLRQTGDAMGDRGDLPCRQLWRSALSRQHKAMDGFRTDRLRLSLQLTLQARELAERARGCAEDREGDEAVARALERTDRLLEDTQSLLGEGGEPGLSREILDIAHRLQKQAWRQYRQGRNPALAHRLSEQARSLASRSVAAADDVADSQDVQGMIESTRRLLEKLDEAVDVSGDRGAAGLLERAHRLLDEAATAQAAGDHRAAFGKMRTASAVASDVAARLGV